MSTEFVLRTGVGAARRSALTLVGCLLALIAITVSVLALRGRPGSLGPRVVLVGTLLALGTLWIAFRQVERLLARRERSRRARPAMRLTAAGLDYSPAFTGTYLVHLDWPAAQRSGYRPGPAGSRYWCLYASAIDNLGPLPSTLPRASTVDPDRSLAVAVGQARIAAAMGVPAGDVDLLAHLLAFGTPIAIDLTLVDGLLRDSIDARLREWTGGRCSMPARRRMAP